MVDFGPGAGRFGNRHQLVYRFEQFGTFVAYVADIHAAAFARFRRQRDQLRGLGEEGRSVDERGAEPHRPFVHRLANERPHPVELGGGRIDVVLAELMHAHRRRSDEARDVGGDALLLHL
jgi:hypothetical protein